MMPVIRLSDETWRLLQEWAVPLEDSAEDVILRLIRMAKSSAGEGSRPQIDHIPAELTPRRRTRKTQDVTPQREYQQPLLEVLHELGDRAPANDVLRHLEQRMRKSLGEADYEELPSGGPRWHKGANWARQHLVNKGLLNKNSPRGIWELTEQGLSTVKSKRQL